jgi:hypothetical protein
MDLIVKRPGARPEPDNVNGIRPDVLIIKEYVTPGRTPSPVPWDAGTVRLKPGAVYALYTGLMIRGLSRPWQLYCEPTMAMAKAGLHVLRVAVDPEIVIYVTTHELLDVTLPSPMVTCEVLNTNFTLETTKVTVETGVPLAPVGFSPAISPSERVVKDMTPPTADGAPKGKLSDAEAAAKVNEWLDSADDKGSVIGADATTTVAPIGGGSAAPFRG